MSRPVDPSWTVGSWATNTNYPAGSDPWSGQPIKVTHPGPAGGFVPGQGAGAPYVNYEFNRLYTTQATEKSFLQSLTTFVGQEQALNFRVSDSGDANFAFFNKKYNSWLLCDDAETVVEARDWGNLYDLGSIVASAGAGEDCIHGDSDPSGNFVIATKTRYVFQRPYSSGTVTKVDVAGSAVTLTEAQVAYDSVRGKWLWWGADGSSYTKNSSNRTSWSSATNPPFAGDGSFTNRMVANPTTGRILFVCRNSSPNRLYIDRTDDAGATWTSTTFITITTWTPDAVWLTYNESTTTWILAASSVSDALCKVWTSTDDGVTWTEVSSFTTTLITSIASIGELWVALAKGLAPPGSTRHNVIYSTDRGVTWNIAGLEIASCTGIYCAAGGFIITTTAGHTFFGHRMGAPSLGTVA